MDVTRNIQNILKLPPKDQIVTIIIGILCLGGIVGYAYYDSRPIPMQNPRETIGEIKSSRGKDYVVNYNVDGKEYEMFIGHGINDCIGKKYSVTYDSNNPDNNKLNKNEPIFTKDQLTQVTVATITDIQTEIFSKKPTDVIFVYSVNGQKYDTYQYYDNNKNNVNVGDNYEVEYLVDNPVVAIIHLDKMIKKIN
jgi:hypothetical protein